MEEEGKLEVGGFKDSRLLASLVELVFHVRRLHAVGNPACHEGFGGASTH